MRFIKYFIFLLFISLYTNVLYAQKERIENLPNFDEQEVHWGYYLGINKKGFKVSYKQFNNTIRVEETMGFNVGLIGDLKLHKNINLRLEPGLSTNTKTIIFENLSENEKEREAGGTYLHVPLLLKFSTDKYNNIRPYIIGGIAYDYNFSSNQDNPSDNFSGEFRLKKHNFMYEMGFGIDFYLYYFKFSPSIRGIFAINNELVYDQDPNSKWTAPVDFFGTRGVFINFTFE